MGVLSGMPANSNAMFHQRSASATTLAVVVGLAYGAPAGVPVN
jgi:hypothetical protein